MTAETKKRRNYREEFKRGAVTMVIEQGYKVSEANRSLGVGDSRIRRWRRREFEEEASVPG